MHTDGSKDVRGIPSKLWAKLNRRLQKKKGIFTFVCLSFFKNIISKEQLSQNGKNQIVEKMSHQVATREIRP